MARVWSCLCRLLRLRRLQGLLPVAADHNAGQEAADDGAAEEDEDDGDADGPDARREEGLQGVVLVDEGLLQTVNANSHDLIYYTEVLVGLEYMFRFGRGMVRGPLYHQQGPDGVVGEDGGCYDEHAESDEAIELRRSSHQRSRPSFTLLKLAKGLPQTELAIVK